MWATSKLGPGDYAEVVATTKALNAPENEGQLLISTILVLIISHGFLYPLVHGSHLLTLTYERFQWSPWILSLGVLVGSVGFTILVLAFFLLQNQRMCSRSE